MVLKKASLFDIVELKKICTDAYAKNFHHHWNENGLEWYLEREFGDKKLKADLTNRHLAYYFIVNDEKPAGFVKIRYNALLSGVSSEAVELEKIYILPEFKRKGMGKAALSEIIKSLKKQGIKTLFLSMIDSNTNALAFYKKQGFTWHSNTRFDLPYFKEELKEMHRMVIDIN